MFVFSYENIIDPLLRDVRRTVAGLSGLNSGDRVLDVCCGTGAQVFEYGKRGFIAAGIDVNPQMFRKASRKQKKGRLDNVSFYLGDAVNLPFADDSFHCACLSFGLHDKVQEQRYRIVSEMKRVVKKDGVLVFVDYNVPLPKNVWGKLATTIEFLVGGTHYMGFKNYLRSGGLVNVFNKCHLRQDYKDNIISGLGVIVRARVP